jgi:ribose transport system substrate-binding protein
VIEETAPPSFEGPTTPVTPKSGVTVADVLAGAQFEGVQLMSKGLTEASEAMGWTVTEYDGKGTVNGMNEAIKQATAADPDVLVLNSIDPRPVQAALKGAEAAGIEIVSGLGGYDEPNPKLEFSGVQAKFDVMSNFTEMGKAAADWIIADSKGKADVLLFVDTEYPSNVLFNEGANEELEAKCPECTIAGNTKFLAAETATTLGPNTVSALRSDPSIDYVVASSDPFVTAQATSITQAGLQDKVSLISNGGYAPNLELIRKQDVQKATVAFDPVYVGWATADQIARLTAGKPLWKPRGENVPIALVTENNVPSGSGSWKAPYDYGSEFLKLWGAE